jgi:hypothetical protein
MLEQSAGGTAPTQRQLRLSAAAQTSRLFSSRRGYARAGAAGEDAGGEPICGAVPAATECAAESDRVPWVVFTFLLCAAGLFAVQTKSFLPLKSRARVTGYLPNE